jgi:tryptophan 2,3-dioxygenase
VQFRQVEFALGHKRESALHHYPDGSTERATLAAALEARTVWDSFARYLEGHGFAVPDEVSKRDVRQPVAASEAMQDVLLSVYRQDALISQLCERLVDLDEGIQEWRYRHVKMVERVIGTKTGSGGSSGAEYLRSTLFHPLFPDLWAIRVKL